MQVLGDRIPVNIERVVDGISTLVYRLRRAEETFYLRVLPEAGAGFVPEVYVHTLLRRRGVLVPGVIYVEQCNEALQRSVMITTEIPGQPLSRQRLDVDTESILAEAGHDLAVINSIPVDGFSWIVRDSAEVTRLEAELPDNHAFLLEHLDRDLSSLNETVLTPSQTHTIRDLVSECSSWLDIEQARLVHGDCDMTHIYAEHGHYTGIIDFGEIRGADPLYDLGHFRLHDGERTTYQAPPFLLAGYRGMAVLPSDHEQRIAFLSLLIGVRFLGRALHRLDRHTCSHALASITRDLTFLEH